MATQKRVIVPGSYYHIYNRGNSKQKIFVDDSDKNRFTQLLYLCNGLKSFVFNRISMQTLFDFSFDRGEALIDICAWALMDNHFHILVFVPFDQNPENLSKFIARLEAAYLKYFNLKYSRSGGLFEGRFNCLRVEEDIYLKYLYSYIHLNPLKMLDTFWKENLKNIKKAKIYLDDYKFSSY